MKRSDIIPELRQVVHEEGNRQVIFRVNDLVEANTQSVESVLYRIEGFGESHFRGLPNPVAYISPVFSLWSSTDTESRRPKWSFLHQLTHVTLRSLGEARMALDSLIQDEVRRLSVPDEKAETT